LIRILVEPKNAIIRQYQKLFELEGVKLHFQDEAIEAVADLACSKDTGARGLRSILEDVMLDVMYEIPSRKDARECVITPGVIKHKEEPLVVYEHESHEKNMGSSGRSALA
ncbi:MAG TPA: ATP-dependent Clp protease ATP-binding subunit ClpX, partial [Candidatus Hydrogenedentes bacterium]|nr:ATP-dependent Clp protease ATP-binding subunit ClpX [Candidatus Hydrogenedentota bacterium]